jgi:hypothetical protein
VAADFVLESEERKEVGVHFGVMAVDFVGKNSCRVSLARTSWSS